MKATPQPGQVSVGTHNIAQGVMFLPVATTNGTKLDNRPNISRGVRLNIPSGGSITYYKQSENFVPTGAPTVVATATTTIDCPLAYTERLFVTAVTGAVAAEWIA